MKLENIIGGDLVVTEEQLKDDGELVAEMQKKLRALGLYPGGQFIDGDYGGRTRNALKEFCAAFSLPNMNSGTFDKTFAGKLSTVRQLAFILDQSKNKSYVFDKLLGIERSWQKFYRPKDDEIGLLAFLDRKIEYSIYSSEIQNYPSRLQNKPNGITLVSHGSQISLTNPIRTVEFSLYPERGKLPKSGFDQQGLAFLDPDVTEACVCVGSFVDGVVNVHWSGRNALRNAKFWSATKFIPVLNTLCQTNQLFPQIKLDRCSIRGSAEREGFIFFNLLNDIETYDENIGTSNSIAEMFKRFSTRQGLENWLKQLTGNSGLNFQWYYGEKTFRIFPQLYNQSTGDILLDARKTSQEPSGSNQMSAYDLTRIITMLGWHNYIAENSRLPNALWDSLKGIIKSMGRDRARYIDVAFETLGLGNVISSPAIVSKLGLGDNRDLTYVAFAQFVDERLKSNTKPAKLRTLAMALRVNGAQVSSFIEADVRMATEVTEIIRRVVTEEFA